jgi:hypothetical protein
MMERWLKPPAEPTFQLHLESSPGIFLSDHSYTISVGPAMASRRVAIRREHVAKLLVVPLFIPFIIYSIAVGSWSWARSRWHYAHARPRPLPATRKRRLTLPATGFGPRTTTPTTTGESRGRRNATSPQKASEGVPKQSTFLRLSRELRDMIYHEVKPIPRLPKTPGTVDIY